MTLGEFREATKDLPDTVKLCYHAYDKGCGLSGYNLAETWTFPKEGAPKAFVLNPGTDYDHRKPPQEQNTVPDRLPDYPCDAIS